MRFREYRALHDESKSVLLNAFPRCFPTCVDASKYWLSANAHCAPIARTLVVLVMLCLSAIPVHGQGAGGCSILGSNGEYLYSKNSGCAAASNVVYAPAFAPTAGTDPCAQINAAITALTSGGTVDARGYTSPTCTTPINITQPVTILFGVTTWTFNVTPPSGGGSGAINIQAPAVTLECSGYSIHSSSAGTVLTSATAMPLIFHATTTLNQYDGLAVNGCTLNGSNRGTFGIFSPTGYNVRLHDLSVLNFTGANILLMGAENDLRDIISTGGGDGIVLGADSHAEGRLEANAANGDGWHIVAGGSVIVGANAYECGYHCMHLDGVPPVDFQASFDYTTTDPKIILPANYNASSYVFYEQAQGTAGSYPSAWCQTIGCITSSGGTTWINAGTGKVYGGGVPEPFGSFTKIDSANMTCANFGAHSGDFDLIRDDGGASSYTLQERITDSVLNQAFAMGSTGPCAHPAHGIHAAYIADSAITNTQFYGGAWPPPSSTVPDLGGVFLYEVGNVTLNGVDCIHPWSDCVALSGSGHNVLSAIMSHEGGLLTDTNTVYGLAMDSTSSFNTVESATFSDGRGTPYQYGISSSGISTTVKNVVEENLHATPDSGTFTEELVGVTNASSIYENIPAAGLHNFAIGGLGQAYIDQYGFHLYAPTSGVLSFLLPTALTSYSFNFPSGPGSSGQALISGGGGSAPDTWGNVPQVGTPIMGQAACIKAVGPVVIGYCSSAVSNSGACTCM